LGKDAHYQDTIGPEVRLWLMGAGLKPGIRYERAPPLLQTAPGDHGGGASSHAHIVGTAVNTIDQSQPFLQH
jgi:hypothetical protein